jgi:hypothetical protein
LLRYGCEANTDPFAGRMLVRDMFNRGSKFSRTGSQDCSDKDATWTKKPPNDFRGSLTIVGVNNGGKDMLRSTKETYNTAAAVSKAAAKEKTFKDSAQERAPPFGVSIDSVGVPDKSTIKVQVPTAT